MSRVKRGPWRGGAGFQAAVSEADGGLPGQPAKKRLTTSAMIASLAAEGQRTSPAPFGRALVEAARTRPEIVGMTADLGKYTDLHVFGQEYPDRYYQMGKKGYQRLPEWNANPREIQMASDAALARQKTQGSKA